MKQLTPSGTRRCLGLGIVIALVLLVGALPATANPCGDGPGDQPGLRRRRQRRRQYTHDFVELFNPTTSADHPERLGDPVRQRGRHATSAPTRRSAHGLGRRAQLLPRPGGERNGQSASRCRPPLGRDAIAMAAGPGRSRSRTSRRRSLQRRLHARQPARMSISSATDRHGPTSSRARRLPHDQREQSDFRPEPVAPTPTQRRRLHAATPAPRNSDSLHNCVHVAGTTLSINDVSQNEGNAGTTTYTFTVSLRPRRGPAA